MQSVGVSRAVLIQCHSTGSTTVTCLTRSKYPGQFLRRAVIDQNVPSRHPRCRLSPVGIRGFRIYRKTNRSRLARLRVDASHVRSRCRTANGHVLPDRSGCLARARPHVPDFPDTPVVIDHLCRIGVSGTIQDQELTPVPNGASQERLREGFGLLRAGKEAVAYRDLSPLIKRVYEAFGPERLMWPATALSGRRRHLYRARSIWFEPVSIS